ncbi:uncharacterized protein LOC126298476 isoform X1 [Schistocerca gregaria]|uniref:uncharacterized protein LOC126298476 isoform X1 n=1 Tax=Schistocerca gregaria TaxID=7010 RepID=UPI00211EA78A|nr:uncharacterized protein LOC126298476 isoform X1 [Schistocerca gregaria]
MSRLTEEMVVARTKTSDISLVRKLNCWGSNLCDVSLLRRMPNVELLSLSFNQISTLIDMQYCKNLAELFIRKNLISDINQLCYLQDLPCLRTLWVDDNPCTQSKDYRLTVLRALPNLKRLDNIEVKPEEVSEAMQMGMPLIHPEKAVAPSPMMSSVPRLSPSPSAEEGPNHELDDRYYEPYEEPELMENRCHMRQGNTRIHNNHVDADEHLETPVLRQQSPKAEMYEMDRQNANYEKNSSRCSNQNNRTANQPDCSSSSGSVKVARTPTDYTNEADLRPEIYEIEYRETNYTPRRYHDSGSEESYDHYGSQYEEVYHHQGQNMELSHRNIASHGQVNSYNPASTSFYKKTSSSEEKFRCPSERSMSYVSKQRKSGHMNTNVLSAVLLLIKELDYASLEVLENAVRSRINEFEN